MPDNPITDHLAKHCGVKEEESGWASSIASLVESKRFQVAPWFM